MSSSRRHEGVFVGREIELGELRTAVRSVLEGSGQARMLVGEAGIGKSRLAEEICAYAASKGFRCVTGRSSEEEGAPPYWPWIQATRALTAAMKPREFAAALGGSARLVAAVVPDIARSLPRTEPPGEPPDSPVELRFLFYDAMTSFLLRAARNTPLLVLLEDLHRADQGSLGLLVFAARQVGRSRLMLLGTCRDTEVREGDALSRSLGELGRERHFASSRLPLLSRAEVLEFCSRALPAGMAGELAGVIFDRTEGNPLFVQQVVSHVAHAGAADAAGAGKAVAELPAVLRDVILAGIARLSPSCAAVLRVAALVGMEFALAPVEAAADSLRPEQVRTAVDQALAAGVLREALEAEGSYRFCHVLVRDACLNGLPLAEKAALHGRVAAALESFYGPEAGAHASELAEHFARSELPERSERIVRYSTLAGKQALVSRAGEEALRHFGRGLATLAQAPPDGRTADLLLGRTCALLMVGRQREALECLRRCFELRRDRGEKAEAARAVGSVLICLDGAPELCREALELAEEGSIEQARILSLYGYLLATQGDDVSASLDALRRSLDIAERSDDLRLQMQVLNMLHCATYFHLRLQELEEYSRRARRIAEASGDVERGPFLREQYTNYLIYQGRAEEARELAAATYRDAEKSGLRSGLEMARWFDASIAIRCEGDWDRARRLIGTIEDRWSYSIAFLHTLLLALEMELWTGEFEKARLHLERYTSWARSHNSVERLVQKNRALFSARAAYHTGELSRLSEVTALSERLLSGPLNPVFAGGVLGALGFAALARNDVQAAASWCDRVTGPLKTGCDHMSPELAGAVARCAGRLDLAVEYLESGLETYAGRKPSCAWMRCELGLALLERRAPGDASRARRTLERALQAACELRMPPLERRTREALARLDRGGRPACPAGLSPREIQVLGLVAAGRTNKEISFELRIGLKTVQTHIARIFGKTGAANRAEASAFAAKHGIV